MKKISKKILSFILIIISIISLSSCSNGLKNIEGKTYEVKSVYKCKYNPSISSDPEIVRAKINGTLGAKLTFEKDGILEVETNSYSLFNDIISKTWAYEEDKVSIILQKSTNKFYYGSIYEMDSSYYFEIDFQGANVIYLIKYVSK